MASSDITTKQVKLFGVFIQAVPVAPPLPEHQLMAELELFGFRSKDTAPPATAITIKKVKLFGVFIPVPVAPIKDLPKEFDEEAVLEAEPLSVIAQPATENKKGKRKMLLAPPHPQELPREYKDLVASKGGDVEGSLTLILGKRLTATDMNKHHNRLSMPQGKIKKSFLNPDEEELIHNKRPVGKRDLYEGISVRVVDPSMKERTMSLARWNSKKDDEEEKKKSWWLALKKDWIKMAAENNLQEEDAIQIWSFRFNADRRLGFILHKVLPPDEDDQHKSKKIKRTVGETSITNSFGTKSF